ncbi:hypothetical protein V5799_006834 [Amblyomma americanum]|uniref:Uncharacterized protein n=1 Tax=Amblyomma americanum TaxID=6943 RepID=A0AAQ4DV95_AMBAM
MCLYVNNYEEESCTSQPQEWGKPSDKPKRRLEQDVSDLFSCQDTSTPEGKPHDPNIIFSYPGIACSLRQILEIEKTSAVDMTCEEIVNEIVEQVTAKLEKETLVELLQPMKH